MHPGYPPPQPENNMGMAVLAFVAFWPLGLIALINANKVNGLARMGDYYGAQVALAESKKWTKYALIVAGIFYGLMAICCVGYFLLFAGGLALSGTS